MKSENKKRVPCVIVYGGNFKRRAEVEKIEIIDEIDIAEYAKDYFALFPQSSERQAKETAGKWNQAWKDAGRFLTPGTPLNEVNLIDTIRADCEYYGNLPENKWKGNHLRLDTYSDSAESGLYGLTLNGNILWYGYPAEINAVVKSMIDLKEKAEKYAT